MTKEREILHQYQQGNRMAKVYSTPNGFEVDVFEGTEFEATKKVHNHSERYAEDCAENWVMRINS